MFFWFVLFFDKDEKIEEGKKRYRTDKNNVGGETENRKETATRYVALNLFSSYSQILVTYHINWYISYQTSFWFVWGFNWLLNTLRYKYELLLQHTDVGTSFQLFVDGLQRHLSPVKTYIYCLCFTGFLTLLSRLCFFCSIKKNFALILMDDSGIMKANRPLSDWLDLKKSPSVNDWKGGKLIKVASVTLRRLFQSLPFLL